MTTRTIAPPAANLSITGHAPSLSIQRQDVFSLPEGPVTIQWPAALSADSAQDIADWLEIVKRKISRSVSKPDEE